MISTVAFRGDRGKAYRKTLIDRAEASGEVNSSLSNVARNKMVWLIAGCLFIYMGAEISFAGWLTTFMGFVTTGYWTGLTVGRIVLGFVLGVFHREEFQAALYMVIAIGLILAFWLTPNLFLSAVSAGLFGFFISHSSGR